jgi:hypothetical protein
LKNRSLESALAGIRRCDTAEPATASVKFAYCLKFLEISRNLSNGLAPIRHTFRRTNALAIVPKGEKLMQFALLIYHSPEEFAMRKNDYSDPHLGAWRAYYKALVEAGVYVGANALEVPETGTTVRLREGKRRVQDGPFADTKEQLAGFIILELPSIDAGLEWAARCPGASIGAVEVRPLAPEAMRRGFTG